MLVELHPHLTGNASANDVVRQICGGGFLVDFNRSRRNQVYLTR